MRSPPQQEGAARRRPTSDKAYSGTVYEAAVVLRDALARLTRVGEALREGDVGLADHVLDDLGADLWRSIEQLEADRGATR